MSNQSEQRNFKFISNATWDGTNAYYQTELPHDLSVGSVVEVLNVTSSLNTTGISSSGYNNTFTVAGISSAKSFYGPIASNPGTFTNDTSNRTTSLPTFKRKNYKNTYYVYRSQEVQKYIAGEQDGVYHLLILNSSNAPSSAQGSVIKGAHSKGSAEGSVIPMKKGGKVKKLDIKKAIKKPGSLRKSLGIKKGKKIPASKLNAAAKKGGKLGQRARFAKTLARLRRKK